MISVACPVCGQPVEVQLRVLGTVKQADHPLELRIEAIPAVHRCTPSPALKLVS